MSYVVLGLRVVSITCDVSMWTVLRHETFYHSAETFWLVDFLFMHTKITWATIGSLALHFTLSVRDYIDPNPIPLRVVNGSISSLVLVCELLMDGIFYGSVIKRRTLLCSLVIRSLISELTLKLFMSLIMNKFG